MIIWISAKPCPRRLATIPATAAAASITVTRSGASSGMKREPTTRPASITASGRSAAGSEISRVVSFIRDLPQRLLEVGDQNFGAFEPDRKAHQPGRQAGLARASALSSRDGEITRLSTPPQLTPIRK